MQKESNSSSRIPRPVNNGEGGDDDDDTDNEIQSKFKPSQPAFELPPDYRNTQLRREYSHTEKGEHAKDYTGVTKGERLRLRKELAQVMKSSKPADFRAPDKTTKKKPSQWKEKIREIGVLCDEFAFAHATPIHHLCIGIAIAFVPFFLLSIIWDVMAALIFEIPHLSTINAPTFILILNFVTVPLSMYGYMIEYLMHEYSRLAIIALVCVYFLKTVVHPILFVIRAYMEYRFDGFRNELKHYYENSNTTGDYYDYPIGTFVADKKE